MDSFYMDRPVVWKPTTKKKTYQKKVKADLESPRMVERCKVKPVKVVWQAPEDDNSMHSEPVNNERSDSARNCAQSGMPARDNLQIIHSNQPVQMIPTRHNIQMIRPRNIDQLIPAKEHSQLTVCECRTKEQGQLIPGREHGHMMSSKEQGQMIFTKGHGQMIPTREQGQFIIAREHKQMIPAREHCQMMSSKEQGQKIFTRELAQMMSSIEQGQTIFTREPGQMIPAREQGQTIFTREPGQMIPAREQGQLIITREHRQMIPAREHGQMILARKHGQLTTAREQAQIIPTREHSQFITAREHEQIISASGNCTHVSADNAWQVPGEENSWHRNSAGISWHVPTSNNNIPQAIVDHNSQLLKPSRTQVVSSRRKETLEIPIREQKWKTAVREEMLEAQVRADLSKAPEMFEMKDNLPSNEISKGPSREEVWVDRIRSELLKSSEGVMKAPSNSEIQKTFKKPLTGNPENVGTPTVLRKTMKRASTRIDGTRKKVNSLTTKYVKDNILRLMGKFSDPLRAEIQKELNKIIKETIKTNPEAIFGKELHAQTENLSPVMPHAEPSFPPNNPPQMPHKLSGNQPQPLLPSKRLLPQCLPPEPLPTRRLQSGLSTPGPQPQCQPTQLRAYDQPRPCHLSVTSPQFETHSRIKTSALLPLQVQPQLPPTPSGEIESLYIIPPGEISEVETVSCDEEKPPKLPNEELLWPQAVRQILSPVVSLKRDPELDRLALRQATQKSKRVLVKIPLSSIVKSEN